MTTLVDTCICGAPWSTLPADHVCGDGLAAWSERRPPMDERQRAELADRAALHLPKAEWTVKASDEGIAKP